MRNDWDKVDAETIEDLRNQIPINQSADPDGIRELLKRNAKGAAIQCISNFILAMNYDPKLRQLIRLNELTERTDVTGNAFWIRDGVALTDTDKAYIKRYLEDTYSLTSEKTLENAIRIMANEKRYHPIRDYLNTLQWDGEYRIRYVLHHFLGADTSDLTYECMKMFLMGALKRIFHKGCKFDYCLCLVGSQGIGKSTFFRFLALKDEWYTDDLKKLDDENVYRKLQGHWIIEMGEMMATLNAKSVEEIKSFLSRMSDVYKVPYETQPKDRLRQCVFAGTTNTQRFLPFDRSGNRRFLPVQTDKEQMEIHILADEEHSRLYMDQVWAEAMTLYRNHDFSMKFTPEIEILLEEHLKEFMPEDTKAGIIQAYLDDCTERYVCSRMIYEHAFHREGCEPKGWELREICDIMNRSITGWRRVKQHRYSKYGVQHSWEREDAAVQSDSRNDGDGFIPVPQQMRIPFDEL